MLGKRLSSSSEARRAPVPRRSTLERRQRLRNQRFSRHVGRLVLRCLYEELVLHPKPGLVTLVDNGSHDDMNAATFMRSLFALRRYFIQVTEAGQQSAPFAVLKQLGIEAESRMLAATKGVNTHRGAIFTLGLVAAALGYCQASQIALTPAAVRAALLIQWGDALSAHMHAHGVDSHGAHAASAYGVSGAREEAALGLPSVFDIGLPALGQTLDAGRNEECAQIDALLALMAHVSDTNVYHRGGREGAAHVRQQAQTFVAAGGTASPDWKETLLQMHRDFVARRLSPGGAADLLAASCLVHRAMTLDVA